MGANPLAPFSANTLEVDPADVRRLIDEGVTFQLLDCRRPEELAVAALDDALHIPMDEIPTRQGEIEDDPDCPVVVMCHHGVRSLNVTSFLRSQGLESVWSMRGGIERWSRDVDPAVPRYS